MRFGIGRTWSPIGLDIGARAVKAVQLSRTPKGWRVEAATLFAQQQANAALEGGSALRIAGVLQRQGFRGVQIVAAAGLKELEVGMLELPPRNSGAPVEQIAKAELARTVKASPDALAVGLWDVPAPARAVAATYAMGVAMRHKDADALADVLEGAGLSVRSLDIHAWALARACAPLARASAGVTGVLDIGWDAALLVLIHQDCVIYQRVLAECGIAAIRDRVGQALEIEASLADHILDQTVMKSAAEGARTDPMLWASIRNVLGDYATSISVELTASFSYASHRYPANAVDKLFLTGGGASMADLAQSLSERVGVSVKAVSPAELVECPSALLPACSVPALTVALGLAMYEG